MRFSLFFLIAVLLTGCVDPVVPLYQFETGFFLIEGQIADREGFSEVRVSKSAITFDVYTLASVPGATVTSIDDTGNEVSWNQVEESNRYRPDSTFAAAAGRSYRLRVVTPQGEVIESIAEPVPTNVEVQNLRANFEQEAYFSNGLNRFVPAFRILLDIDDPAGESNYYRYRLRAWTNLDWCAFCERSVYRDGFCIETQASRFIPRYDYGCDAACWAISRGNDINIFDDGLNPGGTIRGIEAGLLDFDGPAGQLVQVEQFSTSRRAFEYNRILKDLTSGAGGLNAPLPAALYGNVVDVNDPSNNVLGYVSVVSVSTARIYYNRDNTDGMPLPYQTIFRPEPLIPFPPLAPCEGATRTRIRPEGWPN